MEYYKYLKSICNMDLRNLQSLQEAYLEIYEGKVSWNDPKNPNPSGYTPKEKSVAKRKQLGVDDPETRSFEMGGPGEEEYARHANLAAAQEKMKSSRNQPKGKPHKFKKNPFWKMDIGQVRRNVMGTDVYGDKEKSYPESVPKAKIRKNTLGGKLTRYEEQVDLYDLILSHLLDEGYAETPEAAEVMMVNMSEEWRESIMEGYKKLPVGKMMRQGLKHAIKGSGQAFRSGRIGSDTTEGQIESHKADKNLRKSSKIDQVARSHDPQRSQLVSKLNKKFGSQIRGYRSLPVSKMKSKEAKLLNDKEFSAVMDTPIGSKERESFSRKLERAGNIEDVRRSFATRGGKRRLPMPEVGRYKPKDDY